MADTPLTDGKRALTNPDPRKIIATGFVADDAAFATGFASAGNNSSKPEFQALYWRCVCVFAFSARLFNPNTRILLFSNVAPPRVDGVDIASTLSNLGVELVQLALTHRLPREKVPKWGNVFYVLDILQHCSLHEREAKLLLFDSDVVFINSVDQLFERLSTNAFGGYVVDYAPDHNVNGLKPEEGGRLAAQRSGLPKLSRPYRHIGGELFGANVAAMRHYTADIELLWQQAVEHAGEPGSILTEEHFWSVLFASLDLDIAGANDVIKRMWTSRNFNNVVQGDEQRPAWHLPAEKRYGFLDMFRWLRERSFDLSMQSDRFRMQVKRAFGVPKKSFAKITRDTLRGVKAQLVAAVR